MKPAFLSSIGNFFKKPAAKVRILILFMVLSTYLLIPLEPFADYCEDAAMTAQASTVFKIFDFTSGITLPPGSGKQFPMIYLRKGETVQMTIATKGTITSGICRLTDGYHFGTVYKGNHTYKITVPSTGYYRVFMSNRTTSFTKITGTAICSR